MKILILGWYYSSNLGDAVICDCVAALLARRYPEAEIVIRDMGCREGFRFRSDFSLARFRKERRRHKLRIAATRLGWDKVLSHEQWCVNAVGPGLERLGQESCDLVVFAGGQLFMDSLALYVEALTKAFTARGIPVFFNACGVGPSWSRQVQARLGKALTGPLVCHVSCRDNVALVNRWCGREIAVPTADPALWESRVYGITRDDLSQTVGLGVMLAQTAPLSAAFRFWRRLIRLMNRRGISWKLFTNGSEADTAFARQLLASLPECRGKEAALLCPPPQSPEALVRTVAQFRSLISFRLHSHIIACSLGIPTVGMVWDSKLPFFFEKIRCPERCLRVSAGPERALEALARAEAGGYCQEWIDALRETSRADLYAALAPYTPGEPTFDLI